MTNYAGIDYGCGKTNINKETGIRHGVISQNSIGQDSLSDFFNNADDLTFKEYISEAKSKLRDALSDYFSDVKWGDMKQSKLDMAVDDAFEAVEDSLNEQYEPQNPSVEYNQEGYVIVNCLDSDLMIIKSPYITVAQFCSPCCPGACSLNSPLETEEEVDGNFDPRKSYNRCYCLGPDWFDEYNKIPYPVWNAETGEKVN